MINFNPLYTLDEDLGKGYARSMQSNMSRAVQEYTAAIINALEERVAELEEKLANAGSGSVAKTSTRSAKAETAE